MVLAAVLALQGRLSEAQVGTYPIRPIRFVVPLLPGGGNDLLARLFAERMQSALGQPVVVENKPGAGGNIGTEFVARQPADGYTLLMATSTLVINPSFFAKLRSRAQSPVWSATRPRVSVRLSILRPNCSRP
ncbi:MAG: hypothetical protein HYU75_17295 [Betaproteobacteria bacterium]|nr:hypothetical protein [Betaproteobacteria bacterium]